jgi:thiamine pyrophosphokinase
MSRIVIFANGELADAEKARSLLRPDDVIVCADGGSHHALALGLQPNMLIGDLDSMDAEGRGTFRDLGIPVQQYSHDKNETDLELALRYALGQLPSSILVVAALGRRLDQTLGNIALLTAPELATLDVRLDDGIEEAFFCHRLAKLAGAPGDLVSLIPWGGAVGGVSTEGLRWPLHAETLYPEKTRGISNEMLGAAASVTIVTGLLLVVHRRPA